MGQDFGEVRFIRWLGNRPNQGRDRDTRRDGPSGRPFLVEGYIRAARNGEQIWYAARRGKYCPNK